MIHLECSEKMKKSIVMALSLLLCSLTVWAQKEIKIVDVDIINDGEGRLYCYYRSDKKPVDGPVRLMDGYRSEYVETEFKAGYATGTWKAYDNNVLVSEGTYKEGYRDGQFTDYYIDKEPKSRTTFVNGKVNGKVTTWHPNGKIATEKEFKNGVEDGSDIIYNEDGEVRSESHYANGKQTGKSVRQITGNRGDYTLTAYYKDGQYDGEYSEVYTDGIVKVKGAYTNGKKTGQWDNCKDDGTKTGTEVYDTTGDLIKKITYFNTGKVEIERAMKNGKSEGVTRKYDNEGKLKSEINYKNGREDGKSYVFYTSNQDDYSATSYYTNGKLNGDYSETYENGKPKVKGTYTNGSKSGKWTYYKNNGKVDREETF